MADFNKWFPHVARWEGGVANNPDDRGGLTNRGVTWATFQTLAPKLGFSPITQQRLLSLTADEAKKFMEYFWYSFAKADKIQDQAVAEFIADWFWATPAIAGKRVQSVLNNKFSTSLLVDGIIGTKTLSAINSVKPNLLYTELLDKRKADLTAFTAKLSNQKQFLKGWFNRIDSITSRYNIPLERVATIGIGTLFFFSQYYM